MNINALVKIHITKATEEVLQWYLIPSREKWFCEPRAKILYFTDLDFLFFYVLRFKFFVQW